MGCCSLKKKEKNATKSSNSPTKIEKKPQKGFIRILVGSIYDTYEVLHQIGAGSYGRVKQVRHKLSNADRAVKTILKTQSFNLEKMMVEVNILRNLDHPNIIRIFDVIANDRTFNIVMELCTGGELFDRIKLLKKFSEKNAANYIADIVSAIKYCHEAKIVHRDLKPENILFENERMDSRLKIIDFGTSSYFKPNEKLKAFIGTSYYVAPEVINNEYDEKCDVWSIGIILHVMLCGMPPFLGKNDEEIFEKILKQDITFKGPIWETISDDAKLLIQKMLTKNPQKRISIQEVFLDPWIQKNKNHSVPEYPIAKEALSNLNKFRSQNSLRKIILNYIASQYSTQEEMQDLRTIFEEIDKNGDAKLTIEELSEGFQKFLGDSEIDYEKIMKECDADHNGYLDYTEFLTAASNWKSNLSKERLISAFNALDIDGNGKITFQELIQILGSEGIDENYLKKAIEEYDKNHDGELDFDEFSELMLRTYSLDNRI